MFSTRKDTITSCSWRKCHHFPIFFMPNCSSWQFSSINAWIFLFPKYISSLFFLDTLYFLCLQNFLILFIMSLVLLWHVTHILLSLINWQRPCFVWATSRIKSFSNIYFKTQKMLFFAWQKTKLALAIAPVLNGVKEHIFKPNLPNYPALQMCVSLSFQWEPPPIKLHTNKEGV